MSTLKELRTRIKSVRSTQKITLAMKMVASSKLKRAQDALSHARPYVTAFEDLVARCLLHDPKAIDEVQYLLRGYPSQPILIIGFGSNRGLCGGYNTNVLRQMLELEGVLRNQNQQAICLLPIGRKLRDGLAQKKKDFDHNIPSPFKDLLEISFDVESNDHDIRETILNLFDQKAFQAIYAVTGHFKNPISQPILSKQIFPFDPALKRHPSTSGEILFEPDPDDLCLSAFRHYLKIQIQYAFLENAACEHAARMTAMDHASKNGRDMLNMLQLQYNKGRQAQITNELIEIISGSDRLL